MSMRHLASPVRPAVSDLIPASMQARRAGGTRQAIREGLAGRAPEKGLQKTGEPNR
jgi:hypothetical protein